RAFHPPVPSSLSRVRPAPYPLSLHDALPIYRLGLIAQELHHPGGKYGGLDRLGHCVGGQKQALVQQAVVPQGGAALRPDAGHRQDRKSTRLNSSHVSISYAVFCLKKKNLL